MIETPRPTGNWLCSTPSSNGIVPVGDQPMLRDTKNEAANAKLSRIFTALGIRKGGGTDMDEGQGLNREAVILALSDAEVYISNLKEEIESGEHDDSDDSVLKMDFEWALEKLCYAWHIRYRTDKELQSMSQELYCKLCDAVPNWSGRFYLVDPGDLVDDEYV